MKNNVTLVALATLAVGSRLVWWMTTVAVIENEGAEYARLAESLFGGAGYLGLIGYNIAFPPLYPVLIGLLGPVVGDLELAGRLISLASGTGVVLLLFLLARELFSQRAALLAGLFAALHPVLVALSVSVFTESLAMVLLLLGVYLAIRTMSTGSAWRAAASGSALGLGYLVKPELLLLAGVVSLLTFAWLSAGQHRLAAAARVAVLPVAVAALIASPYIVMLSREAGAVRWEGKSIIVDHLNVRQRTGMTYAEASHGLPAGDPALPPPYHQGTFLTVDQREFLRDPPADLSGKVRDVLRPWWVRMTATRIWGATAIGAPALLVLAVLGCLLSPWWRRQKAGGFLFGGIGLFQAATILAVEHQFARYFFPLVPVLIPWAAAGVDVLVTGATRLARGAGAASRPAPVATVAAVGSVLVLAALTYGPARRATDLSETRDASAREAGRWIHAAAGGGTSPRPDLMAFSSALAFYAGATLSYPPFAPSDEALAYIRQHSPDFIALRSSESSWAPYVLDWLAQGIPDACAVPAYDWRSPVDVQVRVWRWKC